MNFKHILAVLFVVSIALTSAQAACTDLNCADCVVDTNCIWATMNSVSSCMDAGGATCDVLGCDATTTACYDYRQGCSINTCTGRCLYNDACSAPEYCDSADAYAVYGDGPPNCYSNSGCTTPCGGAPACEANGDCNAVCGGTGYSNDNGATCYPTGDCIAPECGACVATPSCDVTCGETGYSTDFGNTCYDSDTCISECIAPTCSDEIQNGAETGIDCGGSCGACPDAPCNVDGDCSGICSTAGPTGVCADCIDDSDCTSTYCNADGNCVTDTRTDAVNRRIDYSVSSGFGVFINLDLVTYNFIGYDMYIGNNAGTERYFILHTDSVPGQSSVDMDLSSLEKTSSGDYYKIFMNLPLGTATKTVLIPYVGTQAAYFCCPDATSINKISPACSNIFEPTKDANGEYIIIETDLQGQYLACEGMTGSGAGSNGNASLITFDEFEGSNVVAGTDIDFFAYYYNSTNAADTITPGEGGGCWVEMDDAWGTLYTMGWNGTHYNFTDVGGYPSASTHYWNVTCNDSTGTFATIQDLNDDIEITSAAAPEFNDLAYVLAAVLGAGGFVLIRKYKHF